MATAASIFVRIGAKISDFEKGVSKVQRELHELGSEAQQTSAGFASLMSLGPAITPVLSSVAAGGAAIGSAFTAAGVGVAGFSAVAVANLNDVFEAQEQIKKAQEDLVKASSLEERKDALREMKQATQGLSKAQMKALKSLQSFQKYWAKFSKSFQDPVTKAFAGSLNLLKTILKRIKPAIRGAAKAINFLIDKMNKVIKTSPAMQKFFKWIGENAGPMIKRFGKAFINIMKAVANIMVAFGPLANSMTKEIVKLTKKFAQWSKGLKDSKGFQKFIAYVKKNGPVLMKILKQVAILIGQLLKIMAPIASVTLQVVLSLLKFVNSLLKTHEQAAQVIIVAIQLLGVLKLLSGPIMLLIRLSKSFFKAMGLMAKGVKKVTRTMRVMRVMGKRTFRKLRKAFRLTMTQWRAAVATTVKNLRKKFRAMRVMMIRTMRKWKTSVANATKRIKAKLTSLGKKAMATAKKVGKGFAHIAKSAGKAAGKMAVKIGKMIAKYALLAARSLIYAARVAASWFIAMGPIGWVIAAVVGLVALIIANWGKVKKWTVKIFGAVWNWLKKIWRNIKSFVVNSAVSLYRSVVGSFRDLKNAVWGAMQDVWDSIQDIWQNVMSFFRGINLWEIGQDIIQGLINGISSMGSAVWEAAQNIASNVMDSITSFLGIGSPSKVLKQIGLWTGQGLVIGMDKIVGSVKKQAGRLASAAVPNLKRVAAKSAQTLTHRFQPPKMIPSLSGGGAQVSHSTTVINNFNIQEMPIREEADIDQVSERLYEKQKRSLRASGVTV